MKTIHPDMLPIAPLIYVAWADAALADDELARLRTAALEIPGWSTEAQTVLETWLDGENAPSATDLARLRHDVLILGRAAPARTRETISKQARALAQAAGADDERWASADAQRALTVIDESLGLVGAAAYRNVLPGESANASTLPDSFEPATLQAVLDGRWASQRAQIETLLEDPQFRYREGLSTPAYRALVLQWLHALGDAGIGALAYPGVVGENESVASFIAAFRTLATFDLSLVIKAGVQFGLFGGSIFFLGTEKHHQRYLSQIADVSLPGCFAMTEQGHGSDVRSIGTTATYDKERDGFIVHTPTDADRKEWIGNAADHGTLATVFAQLYVDGVHHDVHALVVPIRNDDGTPASGVRIGDCGEKLGLNGVDNGRLWFDNVFVPRDNLLDRYGSVDEDGVYSSPIASPGKRFFTMLGTLVGGRVSVGAGAVSISKSALTIAVRYATRRRQFGPDGGPETLLLAYPTHQARLMPALAGTYALHFALADLIDRYGASGSHEGHDREVEALAAALKAAATDHATATVQTCREACGGQGYAARNRFAALKADSDVFTTFEGDNTVLRQLVARSLLGEFQTRFSDNGIAGVARFVMQRAAQSLSESNPVIARKTSEEHLCDPTWHADLLHARQDDLVTTAARRMQKRMNAKTDAFEAFLQIQLHVIAAADAWTEAHIVSTFAAAIETVDDDAVREALKRTYELDVLHRIRNGLGWYIENGYIAPQKARAIRRLHEQRCADVAEDARTLVDAFGIPDTLIAAPIGLR